MTYTCTLYVRHVHICARIRLYVRTCNNIHDNAHACRNLQIDFFLSLNDVIDLQLRCGDVTADGTLVTTGGRDKVIRVFDVETSESICLVDLYEDVYELAFARDAQIVVALMHKSGERRLAVFSVHWKK